MRRISRKKLSSETVAYLAAQTAAVLATPAVEQKTRAKKLWKQARGTLAFKEIRRKLERMATGLRRCMYCEDSRGVDIDHFFPLAPYPEKAFTWHNYLYACSYCNSNQKREQFPMHPESGRPLLLKPTKDDPFRHLVFTPSTGRLEPRGRSLKGKATIEVFGLNTRPELPEGRRNAFTVLELLLIDYADQRNSGNIDRAVRIQETVKKQPFSAVFAYLVQIASGPAASVLLRPKCLSALATYPEITTWV